VTIAKIEEERFISELQEWWQYKEGKAFREYSTVGKRGICE